MCIWCLIAQLLIFIKTPSYHFSIAVGQATHSMFQNLEMEQFGSLSDRSSLTMSLRNTMFSKTFNKWLKKPIWNRAHAVFNKTQYRVGHLNKVQICCTDRRGNRGTGVGGLWAKHFMHGTETRPLHAGRGPFIAQATGKYLTPLINISKNGFQCHSPSP